MLEFIRNIFFREPEKEQIDRNDLAFMTGQRDFLMGVKVNPYPPESGSYRLWDLGWKDEYERKQADEAW